MKKTLMIVTTLISMACEKEFVPDELVQEDKKGQVLTSFTVVDEFTNEPIPNINLKFDIYRGSGDWGGYSEELYPVTTDQEGKANILCSANEMGEYGDVIVVNPTDSNSTNAQYENWTHESISFGKRDQEIRLKPAYSLRFVHPAERMSTDVDTIKIAGFNQSVIICKQDLSYPIYIKKGEEVEFTVSYITNNQVDTSFQMTQYFPFYFRYADGNISSGGASSIWLDDYKQ